MFKLSEKPNTVWRRHMRGGAITLPPNHLFARNDRFFLLGSCFAEEIRLALEAELGPHATLPDYRQLQFDPSRAKVDELPERNHLNSYNTFSVRQELERALGMWSQDPDDYWTVKERVQDPYRRLIFADTPEYLFELIDGLNTVIEEAFQAADHFVFTFGMSEVFVNRRSGLVVNQKPGYYRGGGEQETVFKGSSVSENKDNILAIADLIAEKKPNAKVVVTVSPVPLAATFSGQDIVVANTVSKSTLRAALGEAVAKRDNLIYMPSYERVMMSGRASFEADGRHVRRDVVKDSVGAFVSAHFPPA